MDFSPADLFRSTKTGSRSSLDRVNKQLSASRGTFRQKVHIGVLVATVALVAYGASLSGRLRSLRPTLRSHAICWELESVRCWRCWSGVRPARYFQFLDGVARHRLIVILSPKIPGLSYTGGLGMTGWIKIPGIGLTFQPVELAKLITIFFIATLGSQYNGRIDTVRDYVKLCGMLSIPFLAVVAMGDLGSGLVVLVSGAIVICMSGARREWVLSTLALLVGLVALVLALDSVFDSLLGHDVLIKQYQMNRLTVFIDPDNADSDDAYNLQQSLIAVGSGGFFGKGLGHATQSAGGFLPEFHTDFVFAFLSETFGFCGSFLLLCLYVLLIFSTIRVAFKCESLFLRLSCVGIVGMWAFQTFENIGMCIGMMPITGIPLPFISFGSSSMMIQLLTVGIVQSIWRHRSGAA